MLISSVFITLIILILIFIAKSIRIVKESKINFLKISFIKRNHIYFLNVEAITEFSLQ